MVFTASEEIVFGKGNPVKATELGVALKGDRLAEGRFRRKFERKFKHGLNNNPIVTFAAHSVNFSELHVPNRRTSWSVPKLLKESPNWYLSLGHPQRCKGICIDTQSQCPRLNVIGRSYCEYCLGIKKMTDSIYVTASGDSTRSLIEAASKRREDVGTTLNDEIDFLRARMGEILALRTGVEKANLSKEEKAQMFGEIDAEVDNLLNRIRGMVLDQSKIENNQDSINIDTFARVMEGALAEVNRSMIDDVKGKVGPEVIKLLKERHEETTFRILDSILPDNGIAKAMGSGIKGNLFAGTTRKAINPTEPLTIVIE